MNDSNVLERKIAVIMFSDMKGFSAKMGDDEETTFRLLSYHNKIMQETIGKYGGKVIKTIGDAFMIEFASPVNAVKCAYDVQEQFLSHNLDKSDEEKIILRIGIHMGDILITENDIFGDGVNIAARLEPKAPPGGICVSDIVYNFVKKQVKLKFEDGGKLSLKNIKEPVQVYEVIPKLEDIIERGSKRILQYEIKEKIFDSVLGNVYRAVDSKLKRIVILKNVNPAITANSKEKNKLLNEIRNASEINHPNIVTIIDYCEHNRELYLVLEYVEGLDINKWVVANKPKVSDIFTLTSQIADALTRLHQKGHCHLHIKANDILISKTGWLKFLALGLTKYLPQKDLKAILEKDELIRYRSPEQILRNTGDKQSDIFSFGMVFYEFCTGKIPYTNKQLIAAVSRGSLPPLPSITVENPDIPQGLASIIMKCISFKPEDRYKDMKEVLIDLRVKKKIFEGELSKEAEREAKERMEKEFEKEKIKREFEKKSPIEITVSPDSLKVYLTISDVRYYEDKAALDIIERILKKGIVKSLDRDKIAEIVEKQSVVENELIGEGTPQKDGNDAKINFKIDIEVIKKLKLYKNESIDLSTISQWKFVRSNELIARKIPCQKGVKGVDVYGKPISAKNGKDYRFPIGKGLFVSDDGLSLYSEYNGIPYIDKTGRLNVLNLLVYEPSEIASINTAELPKEDIVINNKILSPIELDAPRSIYIKGDIATDGEIRSSNGDIIISGSLKGKDEDHKFYLNAGKRVTAERMKFTEVRSGGTVEAPKGIYCSNIEAQNGIRVDDGPLCGGYYYAENWIRAKVIGNKKNEETVIQVGSADKMISPEIEQFQYQIADLRKMINKLQTQLDELEKQKVRYEKYKEIKKDLYRSVFIKYKQVLNNLEKSRQEEKKRRQAIEFIQTKLYNKMIYEKKIYIADTIYPGVQLKILDLEFTVNEIYNKPQIIVRDGQIKILHEKV